MSTTTDLSTLKINYLTQAQYDDALENGDINPNELYFTPDTGGSSVDTDTTYSLANALSSHKFTSTLTAGGSGSGTSTATIELAAGSNVTLTDDTTNKKITIAATDTTYQAGTTALLEAGSNTTNSVWTPKILHDYIASNGGSNFYVSKTEGITTTTTANQTTVAIAVTGYSSSTDILLVDINGLALVGGTDYTISGSNIVLTTGISVVGTPVHFVVLKVAAATGSVVDLSTKQDILVSGTNIKTINGNSVLGSGNLAVGLTSMSVTITAANWNNTTTCTKTVSGVTSSNNVFVAPAPSSISDYAAAGVYCSAQGTNSLTFTCSSTPSSSITVNVAIG